MLNAPAARPSLISRLSPLGGALLATLLVVGVGCEKEGAQGPAGNGPAAALSRLIMVAKSGNKQDFMRGLSSNFRAVVTEYEKIEEIKPDVKGTFRMETFMVTIANSPSPSEEVIQGNTAYVRAKHSNGVAVKTQMTLEDGQWRLEVPGQLAVMLDNVDDLEKLAKDEEIALKAKLPTGGGGKANNLKSLPADATDAQKAKAKALDAFDLGVMSQADALLADALKQNPDDEDLAVALGRALVQKRKGDEAVAALKGFLDKHPKAVKVMHYLGMAYLMQNRAMEAATQWRAIAKIDPAYSTEHNLEKRAQVAEKIADGKTTEQILKEGGQALGKKKAGGGAASQPAGAASQPAGGGH